MMLIPLLFPTFAYPADWPSFRGPTGMGHTTETQLPKSWGGKEQANLLWKLPLPGTTAKGKADQNQSSPVIINDLVFVTSSYWPEGVKQTEFPEHHVTCIDLRTGKQQWDTVVPVGPLKLTDLRGGYTAPTPCADRERVYVLFGSSTLAALDHQGKIVWQNEVPHGKDFDVAIASSPVLHDGLLYLLADRNGKKSTLTAFDPATGKQRWEQKRSNNFGHTTPVFVQHAGKTLMLVSAPHELQALDPATGERRWWYKTPGDVTSPVYAKGSIYTDSGRGGPGVFVKADGKDDVSATHLQWTLKNIPEALSSPIIAGDYLYRLHNPGVLKCVELATGKIAYEQRLEGVSTTSSPFATKDLVYLASAGKTVVLRPGPTFDVVATNDLGEASPASVAVSNGRIVFKGSKHVFCVGTK